MDRPSSWLPPLGLALISACLFGTSWSAAVQAADSGELIVAACQGGVPHPPGFPLYVLVGYQFCQLPWSTPAGRLGLFSLLAGIAAVLTLYGIVVHLTRSRWAAAAAALVLATGAGFWRYASLAEVFALHLALTLGALLAALKAEPATIPRRRLLRSGLAGLVLGLALSNQHSAVLIAPLALVTVLSPLRPLGGTVARGGAAVAGLLIGLVPYLALLWLPGRGVWAWGDTSSWAGLLHHVLRRDYGAFSLVLGGKAAPLENLGSYLAALPGQLGWVFAPLALLGLALLFRRASRRQGPPEAVRPATALTLALLPLLAGPAFLLLFNVDPQDSAGQAGARFHLLPNALLCIAVGVAVAATDRFLLADRAQLQRRSLWQLVVFLAIGLGALTSFPRADVSESYVIEDYAVNALSVVAKDGLVMGTGDVRAYSLLYAQELLGQRPDVLYLDQDLLHYPWYLERQRARRPALGDSLQEGVVDPLGSISRELARGTPVYLANAFHEKVKMAFAAYPVGPLMRLLPPGVSPPPPSQVEALNRRLFRGFNKRGELPDPQHDPWAAQLLEAYAGSWRAIGRVLFLEGRRADALRALARGQDWAPWLEVPSWFGTGR